MAKDKDKEPSFLKALDDFRREMRTELRSLKESTKYCSDGFDEVGSDLKALRKEIQELTRCNLELKSENVRLNQRVEELEQYTRANNLEIKGVPAAGDVSELVKRIGDLVGESITESDIDICHRVPTPNPDKKNIVVRFVRRCKRNAVLEKSRKKRITTKDLGFAVVDAVYINEHLTRPGKQLLGAAIAKKKQVNWRFVWTTGGKVFARRDESAAAVHIRSLSDLDKMTG